MSAANGITHAAVEAARQAYVAYWAPRVNTGEGVTETTGSDYDAMAAALDAAEAHREPCHAHYTSTACIDAVRLGRDELHARCRKVCKFCGAPCRCDYRDHHKEPTSDEPCPECPHPMAVHDEDEGCIDGWELGEDGRALNGCPCGRLGTESL